MKRYLLALACLLVASCGSATNQQCRDEPCLRCWYDYTGERVCTYRKHGRPSPKSDTMPWMDMPVLRIPRPTDKEALFDVGVTLPGRQKDGTWVECTQSQDGWLCFRTEERPTKFKKR